MAPERAKRPHDFLPKKAKRRPSPKNKCPFEDLKKSGNWPPVLLVPNDKDWKIALIPNKYPALTHEQLCAVMVRRGPYELAQGVGHHEVLVTRAHDKNPAHVGPEDALLALEVLQRRYREFAKDKCLRYALSFFNWGASAGASLYHPHYQLLALPIMPPDVKHSLDGSHIYFKKHRRCVHCEMLKQELKEKSRVICENKYAAAVAPFVSRQELEVRIYPKRHRPCFEKTPRAELRGVVAVLREALLRIERKLNDPDLNFFIHTSPLKNQTTYAHYHWHIEILPKIFIPAGFELGTGVEINVIEPEKTAALLNGKKK